MTDGRLCLSIHTHVHTRTALDDVIMGGVSESKLKLLPGAGEEGTEGSRFGAVFEGVVSSEVGFAAGGFTSIRTR